MIYTDDKFKVHWKGHEKSYEGLVYQVKSVTHDCTCANPNNFVKSLPDTPRKVHTHIVASLISCPFQSMIGGNFYFNGIDEETLADIENPDYYIEIIKKPGDQLSLF